MIVARQETRGAVELGLVCAHRGAKVPVNRGDGDITRHAVNVVSNYHTPLTRNGQQGTNNTELIPCYVPPFVQNVHVFGAEGGFLAINALLHPPCDQ